jgi:hypothetical protein
MDMKSTLHAGSVVALMAAAAFAAPDPIGPDCVNSSMNDIARHGTNAAGTLVGFSSGNVTCNRGDVPMITSPNSTIRPLVGMNLYKFTDTGPYSRIEQLGQGWAKWVGLPINGTNASCGPTCIGGGSGTMGVNCADVYSSGFNGPSGMCARSKVNATLGTFTGTRGGGTDETNINTRVQVPATDLTASSGTTRYFYETIHFLPDDAQHVRSGRTVAINAMNNATTQEVSIASVAAIPDFAGTVTIGMSGIERWAQIDPDVVLVAADHDDTVNPHPSFPGTFIKSRFWVAGCATPLAGGLYRYEFAVFNLNSDRGCGAIAMSLPAGASMTDTFFRHPKSHSGEPFSNAAWTFARSGNTLTISTDAFAANANANAIRWGTMYNVGFTSNAVPGNGSVALGLFKPGTIASINAPGMPVPGSIACPADVDGNAGVDVSDLLLYVDRFEEGTVLADLDNDGDGASGTPDGGVDVNDLLFYLIRFEGGC